MAIREQDDEQKKAYGDRVIMSRCHPTIPAVKMGNKLICMASVRRWENFAAPGRPVRKQPWTTYCGAEIPWDGKEPEAVPDKKSYEPEMPEFPITEDGEVAF